MHNELRFKELIATIGKLESRIVERIPNSGLREVCHGIYNTAIEAQETVYSLSQPNTYIRVSVVVVMIFFIVVLGYSISIFKWEFSRPSFTELVQITEALINEAILLGAAMFFLVSFESRIKRRKALKALHQLRSIAHVVDMHQLTKDPAMTRNGSKNTKNSPIRTMTEFELQRYLDYCSEMFSLIGKIAALYSERLPDSEIVSASNDIEQLCTGLSRKVWQKMIILNPTSEALPVSS